MDIELKIRRNTGSTRPPPVAPSLTSPSLAIQAVSRTHTIVASFIPATGFIFTDQTVSFTVRSTASNAYLLVIYDYIYNYIHVEIIPNWLGYQLMLAYHHVHVLLVSRGVRPRPELIDNEASYALVHYLEDENAHFQLAPTFIHWVNAAGRTIHTL